MYHLTLKSSNTKTGPIPVSTSSSEFCPDICPFKDAGCYADDYHLSMHWKKVTSGERGIGLPDFLDKIAKLPEGQLWRHNQAGDLPGLNGELNGAALGNIVKANTGKKGFTYTHYDAAVGDNAKYIKGCNDFGFTVNLSGNTIEHADRLADLNIGPVVCVLPADQTENSFTPSGRRIVVCPAVIKDNVSCATCGLCQHANRKTIVGFPVHGMGKKKAEKAITFYRKAA